MIKSNSVVSVIKTKYIHCIEINCNTQACFNYPN